jgi:hypothetical protein
VRRTPAGNPIVSDANQTGIQLGSKGWTPGKVVLRTGDYITVNDELKMVTADVTTLPQELPLFPGAYAASFSPEGKIEAAKPYGIFKRKINQQGAESTLKQHSSLP